MRMGIILKHTKFVLFLILVSSTCFCETKKIIDININHCKLSLEIADTKALQTKGLMFRESLPYHSGMLFDFKQPRIASFWMKNTLIPLDIIFINEESKVIELHKNLLPHSLTPIKSDIPVKYAIELNSSLIEQCSIQIGQTILLN